MREALEYFGHTSFRPGQREALETLFDDGRLLLVAPTGGGKSLTYQLPAILLPGTTLVVSPLISLMQDQVSALEAQGVAATFLASTLEPSEINRRMKALTNGEYRIAYVAPERLSSPAFRNVIAKLECPLVAIDEAHCISEWGHDFRPDYMQIGALLSQLPNARVLACTATATPIVRDEILERLGLPADTKQIIRGFARPNLALRVRDVSGKKDRNSGVDDSLAEAIGQPGSGRGSVIIYAPTRKSTEDECMRIQDLGFRVAPYHAGLDGETRAETHQAFSDGALEVVVATNAFGMGIDRADVRAVIHLAPPGSVESYYQEVGRAGRDGEDAHAMMFIASADMPRRRHLIESDSGGGIASEESVQHKWNLFLELMRFAEGGSCRHDSVLRYFGDEDETLSGCGRCDVCLQLDTGEQDQLDASPEDVTLIVRKALAGVARVHGKYGLGAAVALLRGQKDPRLERMALQTSTTFGVLSQFTEDWLTRLLRRCITAGWVDFWGGDRPVVILSAEGAEVMQGKRNVRLLLPPLIKPGRGGSSSKRKSGGNKAGPDPEIFDQAEQELFEALRNHRLEVARAQSVPPYVVASDRTLREIVLDRPESDADLQRVHGIGAAKAERYGAGLLAVVADWRVRNPG
ncbi:MAG TPA: ATP-dependent DNA helicase RecQ [Myxococcales bacterium]|nr:ATP-dependent DNA helicase RecQ [Myxococcales bacterium]HIM02485.1 ATP-dependent DNA helicase RecQ [Myxococcales bacterium]